MFKATNAHIIVSNHYIPLTPRTLDLETDSTLIRDFGFGFHAFQASSSFDAAPRKCKAEAHFHCRVGGLGFRGFGFRVSGLGFRVLGFRF